MHGLIESKYLVVSLQHDDCLSHLSLSLLPAVFHAAPKGVAFGHPVLCLPDPDHAAVHAPRYGITALESLIPDSHVWNAHATRQSNFV